MEGADPLLRSLAAGDHRAFAALYDRFSARMYRVAFAMLGRRQDAEDVVQEVFVAVLQSRQRMTEVKDLTAYVFTASRRAAGRCAERRARGPALFATDIEKAAVSAGPAVGSSSSYSERLQRAMAALPAEQREVLALKIDGDLSFSRIAQIAGVSINMIASRYRYALDKLRASLGGWTDGEGRRSRIPPGEGAGEGY